MAISIFFQLFFGPRFLISFVARYLTVSLRNPVVTLRRGTKCRICGLDGLDGLDERSIEGFFNFFHFKIY